MAVDSALEQAFALLGSALKAATFVVDRQLRIVHWNASCEQLFGLRAEQVQGKLLGSLLVPACTYAELDELRNAFARGAPCQSTIAYQEPDGRLVSIDFEARPITTPQEPSPQYYCLTCSKSSYQPPLPADPKLYEDFFNNMIAGATVVQVICDAQGRPIDYVLLAANDAYWKLTGLNPRQHLGKRALEEFPSLEPVWVELLGNVALTCTPIRFQQRVGFWDKVFDVSAFCPKRGLCATTFVDVTERVHATQALQMSEAQARLVAENISDVIWTVDLDLGLTFVSPSIEHLTGYSPAEILARGKLGSMMSPEDLERLRKLLEQDREAVLLDPNTQPPVRTLELELICRDKSLLWVEIKVSLLRDAQGIASGFLGVSRDITERKRAERDRELLQAQLLQAQKMEAIGRLAGSIAHDFNNLLTAIMGYGDLALLRLTPDHNSFELVREIKAAAQKAASLTQQLLAFSRKQAAAPQVLSLNSLIFQAQGILGRLLGEDITLELALTQDLGPVRIDPHQFEQVLLNLAVNARDAMPQGGILRVETANTFLQAPTSPLFSDVVPGPYVTLRVRDSGTGMSPEVLSHLFEPFFTTKEKGKGTGLGLATVYGIVRQHQGFIHFDSEPTQGTTCHIYFPQAEPAVSERRPLVIAAPLPSGSETILLVEDDDIVRQLAERVLVTRGYRVLSAGDGPKALELFRAHKDHIDLLVSDIVLPGMTGLDLREQLQKERPELPVLFMSGYPYDALRARGMTHFDVPLLPKPFSIDALARKVWDILHPPS